MKQLFYTIILLFMIGTGLPLHAGSYERNIDFVDASIVSDYDYMLREMKKGMSINTPHGGKGYPTALMKAVQLQDMKMIKFCLKRGASINRRNPDGRTTLIQAVQTGNGNIVSYLIRLGAGVNLTDNDGNTALSIASEKNDIVLVKLLLKKRARKGKNRALIKAAGLPAPEIVKLLLKYGANPGARITGFTTPLIAAVTTGDIKTVNILLHKKKSLINQVAKNQNSGLTPLGQAVSIGDLKMTKHLIKWGARIHYRNTAGESLVFNAIKKNRPYTAVYILDRGVSPVRANKSGKRPLELICNNVNEGDAAIVKALLRKGANANRKGRYDITPLMMAASNGHLEIVKALFKGGARLNDINKGGDSALWYAARKGHTEVKKYLIAKGAKPVTVALRARPGSKKKMVADVETMINAVQNNNISVINQVLDRGTSVTASDWRGRTSLEVAANSASADTVIFLLRKGAGSDKKSLNKAFVCSAGRDIRMVRELLAEGADLNYLEGMALFNSVSYGCRDITGFLLNKKIINSMTEKGTGKALGSAAYSLNYSLLKQMLNKGAPARGKEIINAANTRKGVYLPWKIIQLLKARGADINYKNTRGQTALDIALKNRNSRLVAYMKKAGFKKAQSGYKNRKAVASNKTKNNKQIDLLMQAVRDQNSRKVRAYVRSGISINSRNSMGWTVLHTAAANSLWGDVPVYLSMGADINIRDNNGKTARDIAVQKKNQAFIRTVDQWALPKKKKR